jgi:dUTP pyrophosphatase
MSSMRVAPASPIEIRIQRLPNGGGLPLPAYASDGAAGMDVVAAESLTIRPGTRHAVATGFAMAIPPGYEVQVRPRSGLALKHGITCLNTPGTIDSDYRGEVKVILANLGEDNFEVKRGDRIAQLVPAASGRPGSRASPSTKPPMPKGWRRCRGSRPGDRASNC